MDENLGYDDFLLQNLHGVVGSTGLLPHQDDFSKGAFTQKLQVVKVVHSLDETTCVCTHTLINVSASSTSSRLKLNTSYKNYIIKPVLLFSNELQHQVSHK